MATDNSKGFKFMYRLYAPTKPPTVQPLTFKDTETLTKGDMLNLESGEVDLGATNDTTFIGIALETKAGTDSTTTIEVITDFDAVYAVYDANARKIGDFLDLSGTTGQQTVTTASNNDFIVVANSTALEWTLVRVNTGEHWLNQ